MAIIKVKPWPPVKPMDGIWLEEYGKKATGLSREDKIEIVRALEQYNKESYANAEALNKVLLAKVPMPPKKVAKK
jgi:hypothetical protein